MFDIFCGAKALSALHVQRFCSGYFLVSVVVVVALSSLVALPRETNGWKTRDAQKLTFAGAHTKYYLSSKHHDIIV